MVCVDVRRRTAKAWWAAGLASRGAAPAPGSTLGCSCAAHASIVWSKLNRVSYLHMVTDVKEIGTEKSVVTVNLNVIVAKNKKTTSHFSSSGFLDAVVNNTCSRVKLNRTMKAAKFVGSIYSMYIVERKKKKAS